MSQNDSFDPDVNFDSAQNTVVNEDPMGDDGLQDDTARQRRALIFKAAIGAAVVLAALGFWLMRPAPVPPVTQTASPVAEPPAKSVPAETAESLMPEPVPAAEMPAAEGAPAAPVENMTPEASLPSSPGASPETDPLAWNNNTISADAAPAAPTEEPSVPLESAQPQEGQMPVTPAAEQPMQEHQIAQDTVAEPPAEPAPAMDASIENRLVSIENTLTLLQQKMVSREELDALRSELSNTQGARPASTQDAPRAVKKKAKKKTTAQRSNAPVWHDTAAKAPWVLKSAKPGMAWVSKRGEAELRSLSVGENLPGIGRILSIAPNNAGRWTVLGTTGKIVQ